MTRPFLVCLHDSSPAFANETVSMIRDLAPLIGRRMSVGVVPNWHGRWPLDSQGDYCHWLRENVDELLLHGCFHRRSRGAGLVTWLTDASDEMNGLTVAETELVLERGQREFTTAFGASARGFIAPAWQQGRVPLAMTNNPGLEYSWGFFTLASRTARIPLATWTWDCGRWSWLGHIGYGFGRLGHFLGCGVPVLAIHPRDLHRGFWPKILRLTEELGTNGYKPCTPADVLDPVARQRPC